MADPLNLLVIEDSEADFALLERRLQQQGMQARCVRVDSLEQIAEAIERETWDAVLSDFFVPGLDFHDSSSLIQSKRPDLPFIVVSGTIGEERAAALMRLGAWDFILKDSLLRLAPAIERSVKEAADRRARREAEAQLHQAQKMESVGLLVGGIAHDFNNLITAINGTAELALLSLPDADPLRADLERIRDSAERAAALTGQLLAFSRQQVIDFQVVDVSAVVTGMHDMLSRLLGEDITLVLSAAGAGWVRADRGQLGQVLLNLAINARDAMPGGGTLTIGVEEVDLDPIGAAADNPALQPGGYVRLSVRDTGVGMDATTRTRIFEPFFTTKPAGRGTGLGLPTVSSIVRQSGGGIRVESSPGHGSVFLVDLPRVPAPEVLPTPAATKTRAGGGAETVLLVEDEDFLRDLVQRMLQMSGYSVLLASDAEEGLACIEQHSGRVDLVLTDVVLPGMSGRDLADRLAERYPSMRVLFTSGYTGDVVLEKGVTESPLRFLRKPYTMDELVSKVRNVLDE